MKIRELIWTADRIEHIALHGIRRAEVEEICFGKAFVLRARSQGTNPVYYLLGRTTAGRHLFCVVIKFPQAKGYPVTARPMTAREKKRFNEWKNK